MTVQEVHISIAEVLEVRGYGLNAPELLSVAVLASDKLPPCPNGTVFDIENVFITPNGQIFIKTIPSNQSEASYIPPEWSKGEEDPNAASVYCLGAVLRAAGAEEASDVDLFSLVNILTVAMTGTRPTAHRMGQMARNQLRGRDPTSMLMCVYEELMGDEESNQIDVGDLDDLEDELMSTDEIIRDENKLSGHVVISGNNNVKRAVEYFEDDNGDDALTSTSSGNSTQKETSPFDDDNFDSIDEHKMKLTSVLKNNEQHEKRDNEFTSPIMFEDTTLGGIGSPLSQSTRFDETYIEEKSIDLGSSSFETKISPNASKSPFDDDFVEDQKMNVPKTILQPPTPTKDEEKKNQNPFEEDEENDFHGGTLSGRDPFDDDSGGSKKLIEREKKQQLHKKEQIAHRLSSSSEEIIEATIHDDDDDEEEEEEKNEIKEKEFRIESKPKPIPFFDKAYEADFDNSPPLHHYSTVPVDSGLSPLEEAQRALRANKARHKPSNVSLQSGYGEESRSTSRQRHSNISSEFGETKQREAEEIKNDVNEIISSSPPPPPKPKREVSPQPQLVRPPRYRKSMDVEEEKEDIDEIFQKYKKDPISNTPILTAEEFGENQKIVPTAVVEQLPVLKRRNSLLPSRISGRQSTRRSVTSVGRSMRGKRKTRAIPEFYDLTRHQNIRLRAPVSKKKRLSLHRIEETEVIVELLNGQKVEVTCRSDVISRDVFSLIVQNMNINEHVFFGLSFLRDGEHFFIEDHQRLEKFAPSGWKSVAKIGIKVPYVLHLRFKFYPQILDFIKTDVTINELYLQCRRDILEERIQPKRDAAFELAALALQAEFGNRPPPVISNYFDVQHYLPKRFCSFEDETRLKNILAELHGHYAGTRIAEARHKYIQICQRHTDFGSHIHRVFRTKPSSSHGASPFDPDTGSSIYIGIMPRGIAIFEQQGGIREILAEHQWPETQTLQFDKKRFVIVAVGLHNEQIESTFFTDHHTKSSYFVRFAAAQHRWMMKMRQWKSTLRHENTIQSMPDVIKEGQQIPPAPIRQSLEDSRPTTPILDAADKIFSKMPEKNQQSQNHRPSENPPPVPVPSIDYYNVDEGIVVDSQAENFERIENGSDRESMEDNAKGTQFDVVLLKDPANGLGLTLVDGNLNGVPGVYVKLVADNGAGMKAGVCVGDRIVRVGNESLNEHDRLRAVELVKKCGERVPMTICRLDGYIRHQRDVSNEMLAAATAAVAAARKKSSTTSTDSRSAIGQSRTPPPAARKAANRRQRAVSDFGAIGDALPTLDGDNLINIKAISGLHLDESDEEKGEYRLPTTSMYAFDRDDELQQSTKEQPKNDGLKSTPPQSTTSGEIRKYRYARRSNLEIAEEEEEPAESSEDDEEVNASKRVIDVELERNVNGSLGVQIASLSGRVCIKQLTSEPALSHPDIRIGDVLLYVNGIAVEGKSHQEVVAMLRGGGDRVVLGVQRATSSGANIAKNDGTTKTSPATQLISVMLQKKPMGTLGLSLAKRTMSDGIFIRNIANDSAAAQEGTLKVGDRLVSLDGEAVEGFTPSIILDKLKSVIGPVQITVTRDLNGAEK